MLLLHPLSCYNCRLTVSCTKRRSCDRNKGHPGKCNNHRALPDKFWEKSPFFQLRKSQEVSRKSLEVADKETEIEISHKNLIKQQQELDIREASVRERGDSASKYENKIIWKFMCQYCNNSLNFVCTLVSLYSFSKVYLYYFIPTHFIL